ncbi:MAG TPA: thiamine phosphate synthase [Bacteroidia bacterium]|nr:thiamine phosphate synthase [Bacteroidia bacterium]
MKLIVITPSSDVPDETSLVTKMFESGLMTLHIRKPKKSTQQLREYIQEIPEIFHKRIVLHSHHDLALKFNLKGIHLGDVHLSRHWKYFFVRLRLKMRFEDTSKSRSYSRLQQVYHKEERNYSYYLLGTMFNRMTGDLYSGYYEEGVRAANANSAKNLVARGGCILSSVQKAHQYGFYGIAFNSFLWSFERPYERFLAIVEEFRTQHIVME